MKKILLFFVLVFLNLLSVKACFESVSIASGVNTRYAGHQSQCRPLSISYKTNGTTPSGCFSVSGGGGVVRLSASSTGVCYYSLGEGSGSATVSVSGSCMCNGQGISKTVSFTFEEWGFRSITLSDGTLEPAFDNIHKSGQVYTATVSGGVDKITINAAANSAKSKVSGTGTFPLSIGENVFQISATTKLGRTTSYTIKITREKPKDITKIYFDQEEIELDRGESMTLLPIIEPLEADKNNLTWTSSNEKVITVDSTGRVEVVGSGEAIITVKTPKGLSASIKIKSPIYIDSIKLYYDNLKMNLNDTKKLGYHIYPINAFNKNVVFTSSNSNIVSVDQEGYITSHSYGTAIITVMTEEGNHEAYCVINVVEKKIENILVDSNNLTLKVGEVRQIQATIEPYELQGKTLTWLSSDPNILSVDQTGRIQARKEGYAFITIIAPQYGVETTINVEISSAPGSTISWVIIGIIVLGGIGVLVFFGIKFMREKYNLFDE